MIEQIQDAFREASASDQASPGANRSARTSENCPGQKAQLQGRQLSGLSAGQSKH